MPGGRFLQAMKSGISHVVHGVASGSMLECWVRPTVGCTALL